MSRTFPPLVAVVLCLLSSVSGFAAADDRPPEVRIVNREPVVVKLEDTQVRALRTVELVPMQLDSSPTKPIYVRDADQANRQYFQWTGELVLTPGQGDGRLGLDVGAKRFVIQTISASARLPRGQAVPALQITTSLGRVMAPFFVPLMHVATTATHEQLVVFQPATLSVDARSAVTICVPRSAADGEGRVQVTLSGFLE